MSDAVRFPQRVTFTATLDINAEGMNWEMAADAVRFALLHGDLDPERPEVGAPYTLELVRLSKMEIVEEV